MPLDRDWQIRLAAMQKMHELRKQGGGLVGIVQVKVGKVLKYDGISQFVANCGD
jgi:hypothetical protein